MVDFFELLQKRRSTRDFQEKGVSSDLIREIIKDTCLAPSSGNGQPWKFVVINNKDWIKKLSDESKKNILAGIVNSPDSPLKKYEDSLRNKDFNVFYNSPCLVYIGGPQEIKSLYIDCSLAACYFMFAAAARGLGTCWVNLGSDIRDPKILKEIGMTENYRIVAPIILGYPRGVPAQAVRNEPQILKIIL